MSPSLTALRRSLPSLRRSVPSLRRSVPSRRRTLRDWRRSFRGWRRSRPFWGGVFAILAGAEMYAITSLTAMTTVRLQLMLAATPAGMSALLFFTIFTLLAVLTWFQPHLRLATGLIIVVFSLSAIMLTNLGGFMIGTVLGVHGGALMATWRPRPGSERPHQGKTSPDEGSSPKEDGQSAGDGPSSRRGDRDGSPPSSGRVRRHSAPRALGLGIAFLTLTSGFVIAGPPPASAVSRQASGEGTLFCQWFPWICGTSVAEDDTAPDSDTGSDSSTGSDSDTDPDSGSAQTGTDPDETGPSEVECNLRALPQGFIGTGTEKASHAADVLQACLTDQEAQRDAGLLDTDSLGVETALPPLGSRHIHLVAARENLSGLHYDGIVTLRTAAGPVDVLKFRADSITITAMNQGVAQPGDSRFTLSAGRKATMAGNVVMYVLSQKGKAFGILPLKLSADFPPPLVTSSMIFTDVDSEIVFIRADRLTVPRTRIIVE